MNGANRILEILGAEIDPALVASIREKQEADAAKLEQSRREIEAAKEALKLEYPCKIDTLFVPSCNVKIPRGSLPMISLGVDFAEQFHISLGLIMSQKNRPEDAIMDYLYESSNLSRLYRGVQNAPFLMFSRVSLDDYIVYPRVRMEEPNIERREDLRNYVLTYNIRTRLHLFGERRSVTHNDVMDYLHEPVGWIKK